MEIKKYKIIYADPPWEYTKTGGIKNSRGIAKKFYKTMKLSDIKSLNIQDISDNNSILFLWATYPLLESALEVIKAWGFEYYGLGFEWIKKTVHGKDFVGMGFWTRSNPECCLMGIRGKMRPVRHDIRKLVYSKIRKHSQKPDEVRNSIVELCGDLSRIELFARQKTEGWDVWGNQVKCDVKIMSK